MKQSNSHSRSMPERGQRQLTVSEVVESDAIALVNLAALNRSDPAPVVYGNVRRAIIGRALRRHKRGLLDELESGRLWPNSTYAQEFAKQRARTAGRVGGK